VSNDPRDPYGYGAGDPYGGQPPQDPYAARDPYAAPRPAADPQAARGRVTAPAIFLIICNVLSLLIGLYNVGSAVFLYAQGPDAYQKQQLDLLESMGKAFNLPQEQLDKSKEEILQKDKQAALMQAVLQGAGMGVVWSLLALLALLGGFRMMGLKSYGLAVASAVITVIPCITPCCLLGQIAGIWALIVLMNADVKSAFR
jgi:hypothetical protein